MKIHVTLVYRSETGGTVWDLVKFKLRKSFEIENLPAQATHIRVSNEPIGHIDITKGIWDNEKQVYYVTDHINTGVERYYSGDAFEIMGKVCKKYEECGWEIEGPSK